jgi:hypothetical protein
MKASEHDSNKGPLGKKKIMEQGTGVECLEAKENTKSSNKQKML